MNRTLRAARLSFIACAPRIRMVAQTTVQTTSQKKTGYEHFKGLGNPRWVLAPMVDGSELAFRMLTRKYNVDLCYTPMLHSALMVRQKTYKDIHFTTCPEDRPLVAQFCANDPQILLQAARMVEDQVDAVDINLGCPQGIAKRGRYGAFLQDEWDVVESLVQTLRDHLKVPVWCKIRIFDDVKKTIEYARMIERAGCGLLAVHGRTRDQKGKFAGPADWEVIRQVKQALNIPVIANGNVSTLEDAKRALMNTKCEGVMSAWGLLVNPALFSGPGPNSPSPMELAKEYLDFAEKYEAKMAMVRLHLFKLMRTRLDVNMDMNQTMAKCRSLTDFRMLLAEIEKRCDFGGISFEQRMAVRTPAKSLELRLGDNKTKVGENTTDKLKFNILAN